MRTIKLRLLKSIALPGVYVREADGNHWYVGGNSFSFRNYCEGSRGLFWYRERALEKYTFDAEEKS